MSKKMEGLHPLPLCGGGLGWGDKITPFLTLPLDGEGLL